MNEYIRDTENPSDNRRFDANGKTRRINFGSSLVDGNPGNSCKAKNNSSRMRSVGKNGKHGNQEIKISGAVRNKAFRTRCDDATWEESNIKIRYATGCVSDTQWDAYWGGKSGAGKSGGNSLQSRTSEGKNREWRYDIKPKERRKSKCKEKSVLKVWGQSHE